MGKKKITDKGQIAGHLADRSVPIDSLKLDPTNPKKHVDKDISAIAASLAEFGQQRPILVQRQSKVIIAGNGTYQAAKRLGWTSIAVDWTDLSADRARAYALIDNRSSQLSTWDELELANSLQLVAESFGELYTALELEDLRVETPAEDTLPHSVDVPESFAVHVAVKSEAEQKKLFELLAKNNYTDVRLITT